MKKANQKILFYLLLLVSIGMIAGLSWYAYRAYRIYHVDQMQMKRLSVVKKAGALIRDIASERMQSVQYLSAGEKERFKTLLTKRAQTDHDLLAVSSGLARFSGGGKMRTMLDAAQSQLKAVRSRVEAMSQEYRDLLVDGYQIGVFEPIVKLYENLVKEIDEKSLKGEFDFGSRLARLYANDDLEHSYLAYLIGVSKPMKAEDLEIWDQAISRDALPDLGSIQDERTRREFSKILNPQSFSSELDQVRRKILYGIDDGHYPLTMQEWSRASQKHLSRLLHIATLLHTKATKTVESRIDSEKTRMYEYAAAVLFFVVLLLILSVIFYNMSKETQLLDETLKDIELELSPQKKRELKTIVDRRDLPAIYAFLAQTVKEANESKDLFLANMSHEIRTPLNGIVGFTQLLKNTELTSDQKEFVNVIESSSENLLSIVNDILDLSKINADKVEIEEISFNPIEKFEDAVESYGAKASQKNIEFSVFVDPSLPKTLVGDPTKISQVIVNLLSNAIKFTPGNGEVDVIIEKRDENEKEVTVYFAVEDTGIGISDDQKEKIFEAFAQADAGTSRKYGGTGLGLAISSKLVERMGGKLDIESELGKGSTFFFTLTLPKGTDQQKEPIDFAGLRTALVLPKADIYRKSDENLHRYVEYCNAEFDRFTYDDIFAGDDLILPDLLFVDHRYCRRGEELERFLNLPTKIVLITTGEMKREAEAATPRLSKLIYKPVNFTKTLHALESANVQAAPKVTQKREEEEKFSDLRVLVAEDNPINQKLIRTTLEKFGVEVTLASNGQEAFELRKQNDYDLIFMDIQMPVMNGLDATKEILHYEKVNHLRHIPIVALTANALAGDREKYIEAGMDNYLSKPINLPDLRALIQSYHLNKSKPSVRTNRQSTTRDQQEKMEKHLLLYTRSPMMAKLYANLLEKLKIETRIVKDEQELIEALDQGGYDFALLEESALDDDECLLLETMKDAGVTPLILIRGDEKNSHPCADTLNVAHFAVEVRKKIFAR